VVSVLPASGLPSALPGSTQYSSSAAVTDVIPSTAFDRFKYTIAVVPAGVGRFAGKRWRRRGYQQPVQRFGLGHGVTQKQS
jgi:hypothetical protein